MIVCFNVQIFQFHSFPQVHIWYALRMLHFAEGLLRLTQFQNPSFDADLCHIDPSDGYFRSEDSQRKNARFFTCLANSYHVWSSLVYFQNIAVISDFSMKMSSLKI